MFVQSIVCEEVSGIKFHVCDVLARVMSLALRSGWILTVGDNNFRAQV
jgi:hypothetical protein